MDALSQARVGTATRPFASSVMTAAPWNADSIAIVLLCPFVPLFSTFCHLTERRRAGQAGNIWRDKDLQTLLQAISAKNSFGNSNAYASSLK